MAGCQFKIKENISKECHMTSATSLKGEIADLNSRLQHVTYARELLEKQLNKLQHEKLQLVRESDEKLDEQAQRYEQRLTELHSIIAELNKKIETQKVDIIREEDECSEHSGETCSQFTSNDNNPNESNCTDNEELTGNIVRMVSNGRLGSANDKSKMLAVNQEPSSSLPEESDNIEERAFQVCKEMDSIRFSPGKHSYSGLHLEQLQAEIQSLQRENSFLQEQISKQELDLNKYRATMGSMREERDRLRKKIRELQSKLQSVHSQSSQGSQTGSPTHSKSLYVNSTTGERTPTSREETPIAKIAERVKLKKLESGSDRHILGSQLSSLGVTTTKVAEHLVQPLQEESSAQEIFQVLYSSGSQVSENHIREFEVETERLNARIEHLKSQNDLLNVTLEESKAHCDRLAILIGKYESNNIALQLALNYSNQIIESYEVYSALLKTEVDGIVTACKVSETSLVEHCDDNFDGLGTDDENNSVVEVVLKKVQDNRKAAETVAKRLLLKLQKNFEINEFAEGHWENRIPYRRSSDIESVDGDFTKREEKELIEFITYLKAQQATVNSTILDLESALIDPLARETSISDCQKLDLESAVLMQELMAMKEEKTELKAQVFLLERERAALELRLCSRDAHEQAYLAHIEHLKSEMKEHKLAKEKLNDVSNTSHTDHQDSFVSNDAADLAQELAEGMHREKKLKMRLQELVATLEKVTKNSELRHQQSAEFVNDLKRANSALVAAFEKSKRKYQSKIKKLEQQMISMMDRHSSQVRVLKHRIAVLENDQSLKTVQPTSSETSL